MSRALQPIRITRTIAYAFSGWTACAAVMDLGMAITTLPNALLIHAAAAPLIFGIVTATYYRKPGYSPFHTAIVFTCFVIVTDFCW